VLAPAVADCPALRYNGTQGPGADVGTGCHRPWPSRIRDWSGVYRHLTGENSERPVIRDRFRLRLFRPQNLVGAHDEICRHATSAPPTSSTPLNDLELAEFLEISIAPFPAVPDSSPAN
jgi:hypothetical protein